MALGWVASKHWALGSLSHPRECFAIAATLWWVLGVLPVPGWQGRQGEWAAVSHSAQITCDLVSFFIPTKTHLSFKYDVQSCVLEPVREHVSFDFYCLRHTRSLHLSKCKIVPLKWIYDVLDLELDGMKSKTSKSCLLFFFPLGIFYFLHHVDWCIPRPRLYLLSLRTLPVWLGLNYRFFQGYKPEDFIGRFAVVAASANNAAVEYIALKRFYVGSLCISMA